MPELTKSEWETFLSQFPDAHLLQTPEWGKLKSSFGWEARWVADSPIGSAASGAQILFRRLPFGFHLAYIPKGPVVGKGSSVDILENIYFWREVDDSCRRRRAIFLKVEPDVWWEQEVDPKIVLSPPSGFQDSQQAVQPPRTLVVDLTAGEQAVLGRMKQKTRYNIRLALKKGVEATPSADLEGFYRLMVMTSARDRFGVHAFDYYRQVYDEYHPRGECEVFLAKYQSRILAGLMVLKHGRRAWYFYGGSADENRELMASYLVQWEAMRWAIGRGCAEYDLWGVPDADLATLESGFTQREDGLWGVYRFKRGFGGDLRRSAGPWDRVYMPGLYRIYSWLLTRNKISQG
jgi:peptidoglycan pentaglycine glycine transferase (the first glycine)